MLQAYVHADRLDADDHAAAEKANLRALKHSGDSAWCASMAYVERANLPGNLPRLKAG